MAKRVKDLVLKKLDIVVLTNGKVFQVIEIKPNKGGTVLWMDKENESSLWHDDHLYVEKVINSPTALLVFAAARSIHLRLNNLNRV